MSFIMLNYAVPLQCNLAMFNYRGVGSSLGAWPRGSADLVSDASAVFGYLLRNCQANPKNILIYGHSIGGAVGALVRAKYPSGPMVSDRSFLSFTAVVRKPISRLDLAIFFCNLVTTVCFVLSHGQRLDGGSSHVCWAFARMSTKRSLQRFVFLFYFLQVQMTPTACFCNFLGSDVNAGFCCDLLVSPRYIITV